MTRFMSVLFALSLAACAEIQQEEESIEVIPLEGASWQPQEGAAFTVELDDGEFIADLKRCLLDRGVEPPPAFQVRVAAPDDQARRDAVFFTAGEEGSGSADFAACAAEVAGRATAGRATAGWAAR